MEVSEDYLLNTETGEIKAKRGDIIGKCFLMSIPYIFYRYFIAISNVFWNGSIEGTNLRTWKSGSYLLKEHFKNASFPIFQGLQLE
jgi:hypothetical protein